jgi:signal recognition particle receptor subunit alpha
MLDHFAIFTKGGVLLWTLHHAAASAATAGATATTADAASTAAAPQAQLDAINALVRTVLLEERSGEAAFTYTPRQGPAQTLKWTFHNGLDLVFAAGYQKSLPLLYVEPLLAAVRDEFAGSFYDPARQDYSAFGKRFDAMQREAEARGEAAAAAGRRGGGAGVGASPASGSGGKAAAAVAAAAAAGSATAAGAGAAAEEEQEEDGEQAAAGASLATPFPSHHHHAFDLSRLKGKLKSGGKDSNSKAPRSSSKTPGVEERLDYSEPPPSAGAGGTAAAARAEAAAAASGGRSRMNDENALIQGHDDDALDREAAAAALEAQKQGGGSGGGKAGSGMLGSFMQSLALRVAGTSALTRDDLEPALKDMRRKLMERNVAEGIAAQVVDSVARSLEGKALSGFTGVGALVRGAFEDAVSGVLNKRSADVLLEARRARERGRPYVIVFCGVNGVGKSTNLAKIAYWLGEHGLKVQLAACDTFRAGAVEQLKTHAARLGVPLYERGYERDPAKVAYEAVRQAQRDGRDVVLVDTAGRMQDNEPLMRALANLIAVNAPDLVLFVGEALVGNDAVDQLVKFSRALAELAPPSASAAEGGGGGGGASAGGGGGRPPRAPGIDGIVLTKFDTIDDKVGAALSMTYTSGAPILFVGCGQTYQDLTRLNAKAVVRALLR